MAADFAGYFGIAMGVLTGIALLIGCLATGRTRFNACGAWKTRFTGRCCIIFVSRPSEMYIKTKILFKHANNIAFHSGSKLSLLCFFIVEKMFLN